jgi:hypothetical protein
VVWHQPTRQRHQGAMLPAGLFALPRRNEPSSLGESNHLEHDLGSIGRTARLSMVRWTIAAGGIKTSLDPLMDGKCSWTWPELLFERNRTHHHGRLMVARVCGHRFSQSLSPAQRFGVARSVQI